MVRKSASRFLGVLMGVSVLEVVFFAFASQWVGVLQLFLVAGAFSLLGLFVLRSELGNVFGGRQRPPASVRFSDSAFKIGAGVLLIFPGLLTGIVGGLLLLSPVRALIRPLAAARLSRMLPTDLSEALGDIGGIFRPRGDIIDVTATTKDSNRGTDPDSTVIELPDAS